MKDFGKLARFIKNDYIRLNDLTNSYNAKLGIIRQLSSSTAIKVVNFDTQYEITFSLVNEKPEVLDWNWDIEHFVESNLILEFKLNFLLVYLF